MSKADCPHENFGVFAEVNRITDAQPLTAFAVDLTVRCADCQLEFEFLGDFPGGIHCETTTLSPDRARLSIPIKPRGQEWIGRYRGFSVHSKLPPSGGNA